MIKALQDGDQLMAHMTLLRYHEDHKPPKPDYGWFLAPQTAFRGDQGPTTIAIMGSIHRTGTTSRFVAFNPPIISTLGKEGPPSVSGNSSADMTSSSSSSSYAS